MFVPVTMATLPVRSTISDSEKGILKSGLF